MVTGRARTPRTRLADGTSLAIVLGLALWWVAVSIVSPNTMRWLCIYPVPHPTEGPFEWAEELVLALCLVGWVVITRRVASRRLTFALSLAMLVQLVLALGEELDWGQELGLPWFSRHRNLRMFLRNEGLPRPLDDIVVPTFFVLFLLCPLVPLARVQRWLERAAPIRASLGDALATFALIPVWLAMGVALGQRQPMEFVQMGGYLVVLVITVRVLRATSTAP